MRSLALFTKRANPSTQKIPIPYTPQSSATTASISSAIPSTSQAEHYKNRECVDSQQGFQPTKNQTGVIPQHQHEQTPTQKVKTVAEIDEELRARMEGRSGEGGEAGMELEDGRPVAMKRGVKNNMFRYI